MFKWKVVVHDPMKLHNDVSILLVLVGKQSYDLNRIYIRQLVICFWWNSVKLIFQVKLLYYFIGFVRVCDNTYDDWLCFKRCHRSLSGYMKRTVRKGKLYPPNNYMRSLLSLMYFMCQIMSEVILFILEHKDQTIFLLNTYNVSHYNCRRFFCESFR